MPSIFLFKCYKVYFNVHPGLRTAVINLIHFLDENMEKKMYAYKKYLNI